MATNDLGNMTVNQDAANADATAGGASAVLMIAWQKLNSGEMAEASVQFKKAIQEAEVQFEAGSNELSNVYTDASTGLFLAGAENYQDAIHLLELAIAARTARDGECNPECGRVHRQIASMKKTALDYAGAVASMRKSIDIFEALDAMGQFSNTEELQQMYSDLRELLSLADDAEAAGRANSGAGNKPDDPLNLRSCVIDDEDENDDDAADEEKRS